MTQNAAELARVQADQARENQAFDNLMDGIKLDITDAINAGSYSAASMIGGKSLKYVDQIIETFQNPEMGYTVVKEELGEKIRLKFSWAKKTSE